MRALAWVLLLALCAGARERYAVDWNRTAPEILDRFAALLRVDSSNPPARANLVAHYSGGRRRALPARRARAKAARMRTTSASASAPWCS
jgi:hypothetical protein